MNGGLSLSGGSLTPSLSCSSHQERTGRVAVASRVTARPRTLQGQVDDPDERIPVQPPLAPVGLEIGERLGGDGVVHRFPGRLELSYPVRGRGQHVAILREVGLGAERAVAGDDLGVRVREAQQTVGRLYHAVDTAAGGAVDVGIKAVEKHVAGVQHVGLLEPHCDVGVGVRRRDVRQDRKSTRLNSSHLVISYAVFCLKKKKKTRYDLSDMT